MRVMDANGHLVADMWAGLMIEIIMILNPLGLSLICV